MTAKHAENVLSVPSSGIGNYNKSSSEDFSSFEKKYIKYIPYIPWPTPCEVAVEMQTMVSCEHLVAETRGGRHLIGQSIASNKREVYPKMRFVSITR